MERRSWSACCGRMEAAEREGGDVRGRQSAAIMVVDAELHPTAWRGHGLVMDMRIEDHPDPVPELRRIVTLQLAYDMLDDEGDEAKAGRSAEERYAESRRLAPEAYELVFWRALELATAGDIEGGRREMAIALAGGRQPGAARSSTWRRRAARASRPSWRRSCWATDRGVEAPYTPHACNGAHQRVCAGRHAGGESGDAPEPRGCLIGAVVRNARVSPSGGCPHHGWEGPAGGLSGYQLVAVTRSTSPIDSSQRSTSMAALQPSPAAVTAWR